MNRRVITLPIAHRVDDPSPEIIREYRLAADLSLHEAGQMVSTAKTGTWKGYESMVATNQRKMPRSTWELFLLLIDRHPLYRLIAR